MSKKKYCPLFVERDNKTVCAVNASRPVGRLRCSSEVKAAVRVAVDIYRKEHEELGTSLDKACKRADIAPMQVYDYFFGGVAQILATDMGTVPPRWHGTDPGEILPEPLVESLVASPRAEKAATLAGIVTRLQAIAGLEQEIIDLGYENVLN